MGFFFFFFLCDRGWSAVSGFLFRWDFGGWSGLINDGGNVDLAAAVFGFLIGVDLGFFFFFFPCCDRGWSAMSGFLFRWYFGGWSGLIDDGGNIDLAAAVSGFWSGLIWVFCFFVFCFFLLWSGLIGDVSVFVPVGFWWLIWVDQRWRKHWSSGGSVWVLIGVDLVFFFFFLVVIGVDRRCLGFCSSGILVVDLGWLTMEETLI